MTWQEVLDDKSVGDLPYRIELNRAGCMVMTHRSNHLALLKGEVIGKLGGFIQTGDVLSNCSILPTDNVKVADVAWASESFSKANRRETPFKSAPELCIDVVLPGYSNSMTEQRRDLYLAKGAKEVWICDGNGRITYFVTTGELKKSKLFPRFPAKIDYFRHDSQLR